MIGRSSLGLAAALVVARLAAAGPLEVTHVYRERIGALLADFTARAWAFTSDGGRVYVQGSGEQASLVALLQRDVQTGVLGFVDAAVDPYGSPVAFGLPWQLSFGPGQRELYANGNDGVAVLRLDPTTGAPALVQTTPNIVDEGSSLATRPIVVAPDGRHVYAGVYGAVVTYPRGTDGTLGTASLTHVDEGTVVSSLAITADGRFLYALATDYVGDDGTLGDDDVLLVFARDAENGALHLVQHAGDGLDGRVSLGDLLALAMSPDERHLYIADGVDPELVLTVLRRDPESGRVVVVEQVPRTPEDPPCAFTIATSPDGTLIYVACGRELAVYHRAKGSGRLERVQTIRDGENGADEIDGIDAIAPSPDGRNVYVLASVDHAVTVLRVSCGDGVLDPGEACDDGNVADGDGCDSACRVEPCFACTGPPSVCTPDDGAACDDGQPCTAGDICAAGRCSSVPLADGTACDDGDACTSGDACLDGACVSDAPVTCGTCEVCDTVHGCVGFFESACRRSPLEGRHGRLLLQGGSGDLRAEWRWVGAKRTRIREFGDPTRSTGYRLCVFDVQGPESYFVRRRRRVVLGARVPPGGTCRAQPCWRRAQGGFVFRGGGGSSDGIRSVVLAPGPAGTGFIRIVGGGRRLPLQPLPVAVPAIVQLTADDGTCWQGDYGSFVSTNDESQFAGRGGIYRPCQTPDCGG